MALSPQKIADYRTDLHRFTAAMFEARKGFALIDNWHQHEICEALEKVVIGRTKRLIINIPPRSGKTEFAVISFIAWCMGNWPDSEFIHASYSSRLATNNTFNARAVMQHELYSQIFSPPQFRHDSNAKNEFRTEQGGVVYATGSDGTITGYGAGKMRDSFGGAIIIDDPHKAGEANSVLMRQNVKDWFSTTMESRLNNRGVPIIIIMQRLHEDDLSGWLLGGGNGEKWDHLMIPALTQSGDSFWPKQFPLDDLERMRLANPYVFAGQYLQVPAPIGGGIFKRDWWQFYTELPPMQYRMIYADTAQKTKEQNDYSVLQHWGKGLDGRIYLIDQMRGKWEAPQLLEMATAFWNRCKFCADGSSLRHFKIEDKASGTGLIQQLKQVGIPVIGIPRTIDKITRMYDGSPQVQAGNVVLPLAAPFTAELLAETDLAPNGSHDDQIDPMLDAIKDMLVSGQEITFIRPNRR
jgi:predicted phage terminase large subunit-like protein